jgi:hypothetical protein
MPLPAYRVCPFWAAEGSLFSEAALLPSSPVEAREAAPRAWAEPEAAFPFSPGEEAALRAWAEPEAAAFPS